eukprot:TRINITY_DN8557_c0_g1_i2.p1 TRINITY_DN8557_c0_g1~~TRINITY_DN8557_c0_g1_i2.p1  ORF type:complete len:181 (+),score=33.62 TRINITY_DN8557_c0_g1_i2:232-774(+)
MDEETKAYSERLMAEGKQQARDQPQDELNELLVDEANDSEHSESGDEDEEDGLEKPKKPSAKKPPAKKPATKKSKQPPTTNPTKRQKTDTEAARIDVLLKELFAQTSQVPFPTVHRQVILRHPEYEKRKQHAKAQFRSGHVKNEAAVLQPFFQSIEKVMRERITAMGGVIKDNILTIPKQ